MDGMAWHVQKRKRSVLKFGVVELVSECSDNLKLTNTFECYICGWLQTQGIRVFQDRRDLGTLDQGEISEFPGQAAEK